MDLIILIFLSFEIANLARKKGLRPQTWVIYFVISWIALDFIGVVVALMIFSQDNLLSIALFAFAFAIASYFIIKSKLNRLPNANDNIDNIGKK